MNPPPHDAEGPSCFGTPGALNIEIDNLHHEDEEICPSTGVSPFLSLPQTPDINRLNTPDLSPNSDVDCGITSDVTLDAISELNFDYPCPIGIREEETETGSVGDSPLDLVEMSGISISETQQEGLEPNASIDGAGRPSARRSRRHERIPRDGLKLLNVSCCETGVTLYQQSWHWTETREQDSIGKLVASFNQFANSIQCGEIGLVNFVSPNRTPSHRKISSSSYSNAIGTRRIRSSSRHMVEAMQMLCTQSNDVTVAVFYDVRKETITNNVMQQPMREFMEACKEYFGDIYKSVVQGLRPQLRRAVQEGSNEDLREFQKPFDDFQAITDKLRRDILGRVLKKSSQ